MKSSKNSAIKQAFKLILCYLFCVIASTLLAALVYMVYRICTTLVAGQAIHAFSLTLFLEGALVMLPLVLAFAIMLMAFYLTRHPSRKILSVIVYVVLSLATWYAALPPVLHLAENHFTASSVKVSESILSPGFFREAEPYVFYYSGVDSANNAQGLVFEKNNDVQQVYTFSDVQLPHASGGFSDSLIGETVEMPSLMRRMLSWYKGLAMGAFRANDAGYVTWAFYASMGIALCSVLGLYKVSKWRLLNMNAILYASVGIIVYNYLLVVTDVLAGPSQVVATWFRKLTFIQNPLQVLLNLFVALVFLLVGIISAARNKKAHATMGATI